MITDASISQGNDFIIAQKVVDYLQDYFPGWDWTALSENGIVYFKNLSLSQGWCIQLKHQNLSKRLVIAKGGEFLDRFKAPTRFDMNFLDNAKRDFTGAIESEKWTPDRRYYNRSEKRWKAAI